MSILMPGCAYYLTARPLSSTWWFEPRAGCVDLHSAGSSLAHLGCTLPRGGAQSHVCAKVEVDAPANLLWKVLTDFQAHAELMPNLAECEVLPSEAPNTLRVRQKVVSQTVFFRVEASALLEVDLDDSDALHPVKALNFRMISGDFAELSGRWTVQPDADKPESASTLQYEIVFTPDGRAHIPSALAVFLLKQALPLNIKELAAAAEHLAQALTLLHALIVAPPLYCRTQCSHLLITEAVWALEGHGHDCMRAYCACEPSLAPMPLCATFQMVFAARAAPRREAAPAVPARVGAAARLRRRLAARPAAHLPRHRQRAAAWRCAHPCHHYCWPCLGRRPALRHRCGIRCWQRKSRQRQLWRVREDGPGGRGGGRARRASAHPAPRQRRGGVAALARIGDDPCGAHRRVGGAHRLQPPEPGRAVNRRERGAIRDGRCRKIEVSVCVEC
jgi:ribosome-associated toxin RatA of RatAB toxin-antitoxin module